MIGKQLALRSQCLDRQEKCLECCGVIDIGCDIAQLAVHLRERRSAESITSVA